MKMRKWWALLLALVMALSLAACGRADSASDEAEEEEDEAWAEDGLLMLGSVDGSVYENEMLGIGCDLKGWHYFDADELATLNDFGNKNFDKSFLEAVKNAEVVVEMVARSREGYPNVNITVEDMTKTSDSVLTEETYIKSAIGQLPSAMRSTGFEDVTAEEGTIDFCGETRVCILTEGTYTYNGTVLHQAIIPMAVDNYMFSITITCDDADEIPEIADLFYSL